jgi:hypothetical protein
VSLPPLPQKGQQQQQQNRIAAGSPAAGLPLIGAPPDSLQLLVAVSREACEGAEVLTVPQFTTGGSAKARKPPELQMLLHHMSLAGLAALALQVHTAPREQPAAAGQTSSSTQGTQLALLELFVPAAGGYDSWIYVLEVPQAQAAAAALMAHLAPLLQDAGLVKVMHDARQDSVVLQQQFGIRLGGVLDTQLLAGTAALGGGGPDSPALAAAGAQASSSSSLQRLHQSCGLPAPVPHSGGSAAGLWFQRPLPAAAVRRAADGVRYLLPLAHALLQQLPAAMMRLADLQMRLAQQGVPLKLGVGLVTSCLHE